MGISKIDAGFLKKMFLAGAARLEAKKEVINELNVFPVPDGDTGTNMTLTILSAVKAVNAIEELDMKSLAKAMSSGSLRGARGNSGVILSQLLRGFCKEISEYESIDVPVLANAIERAKESAYKAVMKPKEGTILTVAKGGAEKALQLVDKTEEIDVFLTEVIQYMDEVLADTPNLLPVLKEAGVVDSGGAGLMEVLKGALDALLGKEVKIADEGMTANVNHAAFKKTGITNDIETADIKFGYCTEFIIMSKKEFTEDDEMDFKGYLEGIGDCIVVVADDEVVKVHVHTNDPGLAIQKALTYGELTSMKIDNMREEHEERVIQNSMEKAREQKEEREQKAKVQMEKVKDAFIAVSPGPGLTEVFKGLGVHHVIEGGQTMNPSTEDVLEAIENLNAENIFVFPNNKNIILAADQAKKLTKDKNVIVIPSKTIPQGISSLIHYVHEGDPSENESIMTEAMSIVKSGEITYAVRETSIGGVELKQGDIMGIGDEGIISVKENVREGVLEMLSKMVDDESGLISLYYGADTKEEEAKALKEEVMELYSDLEVELQYGGQPVYYYIVSVE